MAEAYINRGYTLNDMQNAQQASQDFDTALQLSPNNGIAHLGLAFSDLQLRHPKEAREQAEEAQKLLGESGSTHLALATAYRQEHLLASAEQEYRAAIKFAPNDLGLQLALADTLYDMRRYQQSIDALNAALEHLARRSADLRPHGARLCAPGTQRDETHALCRGRRETGRRAVCRSCSIPATPADAGRPQGRDGPLRARTGRA